MRDSTDYTKVSHLLYIKRKTFDTNVFTLSLPHDNLTTI